MKTVKLIDTGTFKARDVITQVLSVSQKGVDFQGMRRRMKVLDVLDGVPAGSDTMNLEDAEFGVLVEALSDFRFSVASRDLMAVIDGFSKPLEPVVDKKK